MGNLELRKLRALSWSSGSWESCEPWAGAPGAESWEKLRSWRWGLVAFSISHFAVINFFRGWKQSFENNFMVQFLELVQSPELVEFLELVELFEVFELFQLELDIWLSWWSRLSCLNWPSWFEVVVLLQLEHLVESMKLVEFVLWMELLEFGYVHWAFWSC